MKKLLLLLLLLSSGFIGNSFAVTSSDDLYTTICTEESLELYYIYPDGKKTGNYTRLDKSGQIYYEATFKDGKCISGDC